MSFLLRIIFICLYFLPLYADVTIKTVWGSHIITDHTLETLLQDPALLRLKNIDQSGPLPYFGLAPYFSRYEHSVGVLVLIRQAQAPIVEQIAGLFHDVSHSAFSHVGDHLFFESNNIQSYQDRIHMEFLKNTNLRQSIAPYGLSLDQLDPERPEYKALERPLPDICADRIQYLVHTGVVWGKISSRQARFIVKNLHFNGEQWFFTNQEAARLLAELSMEFTKNFWGAPWVFTFYEYFTDTIRHAISLNLINVKDFQYGADEQILQALFASKNPILQKRLRVLKQDIRKLFIVTPFGEGQWNTRPKNRSVNPLVKTPEGLKRLSEINPLFAKNFKNLDEWCKKGYGIKIIKKSE